MKYRGCLFSFTEKKQSTRFGGGEPSIAIQSKLHLTLVAGWAPISQLRPVADLVPLLDVNCTQTVLTPVFSPTSAVAERSVY